MFFSGPREGGESREGERRERVAQPRGGGRRRGAGPPTTAMAARGPRIRVGGAYRAMCGAYRNQARQASGATRRGVEERSHRDASGTRADVGGNEVGRGRGAPFAGGGTASGNGSAGDRGRDREWVLNSTVVATCESGRALYSGLAPAASHRVAQVGRFWDGDARGYSSRSSACESPASGPSASVSSQPHTSGHRMHFPSACRPTATATARMPPATATITPTTLKPRK